MVLKIRYSIKPLELETMIFKDILFIRKTSPTQIQKQCVVIET
jgi:hypothetical protein